MCSTLTRLVTLCQGGEDCDDDGVGDMDDGDNIASSHAGYDEIEDDDDNDDMNDPAYKVDLKVRVCQLHWVRVRVRVGGQ